MAVPVDTRLIGTAVAAEPEAFLLTLGSREGLSWVLRNRRMAFTTNSGARQLERGDRLSRPLMV